MASEDPGWSQAVRQGPALLLPQAAMRRARGIKDRVVGIRTVWLSFVVLHVIVGTLILAWLAAADLDENISPVVAAVGVAIVALGASYARWRTAQRPLDCSDGKSLADTYYVRFLRECAIASVVMPWGIIAGLFAGSVLPYAIGLAVGVANLVSMAPVPARLVTDQQRLEAGGCSADLMRVMRTGGDAGGPPKRKRRKGN